MVAKRKKTIKKSASKISKKVVKKKAAAKKVPAKKVTTKKVGAKKKVTAKKKTAKKVAAKKVAAKKSVAKKKVTAKKKTAKKVAAKKAASKKVATKKVATKKTVSKKSTKKTARKKAGAAKKTPLKIISNVKSNTNRPNLRFTDKRVPIVAIGASAGGLEPFEVFFDTTQPNTGVAYVVIQHLSPDFVSMMGELLSRHSSMMIKQVVDGLKLEANTIYLNPPRTEMTLEDGCFKLLPLRDPTQLSLPIDTFFYSLAETYGADSICIVLSGTGSDGTKGCEAISDVGGTVLIQDPESAKFDGMPNSAINAGYADAVGLPAELPDMISVILAGGELKTLVKPIESNDPLASIYALLLVRFGNDFHNYKVATIHRRIERRAEMLNLTLYQFAELVHQDEDELEQIYADLLIDVTSFFRDKSAFAALRKSAIPEIAKSMSAGKTIRVWSPGCASGEEAYSLAICFAEYARENNIPLCLKVMATDIHQRSIASASAGYYPVSLFTNVDKALIKRYFDRDGEFYQVKQQLRRLVVFSQHNVLKDPPFTRMDLVSCRNMLIYMNEAAQQKIMARFHFALINQGVLFLGSSETLGKLDDEFDTIDQKWRLYRKARDVRLLEAGMLLNQDTPPPAPIEGNSGTAINLSSMSAHQNTGLPMRRAYNSAIDSLLKRYAPSGFLLNKIGEVVHVFGDAGNKIKVADGMFSTRIVDIVDDELRIPVSTGLERMRTSSELDFERRILTTKDGQSISITINISSVRDNQSKVNYYLLTIDDAVLEEAAVLQADKNSKVAVALGDLETGNILRQRIEDLDRDLQATEASLQSTIEELETSNEELQATNEELMASNEELQSTNEELHSVNEELYTVSAEHQSKIDELTIVTDDMDHLLRATSIGIIFLDHDLKMRRFTPSASSAFNIMPQDIGRPFKHITYEFESPELINTIKQVRDTGVVNEQEVDVNGAPFMLRLLPYTASLNDDVGVVITLIDISELKTIQNEQIRDAKQHHEIVSDLKEYVLRWQRDEHLVTFANDAYSGMVDISTDKLVHANLNELVAAANEKDDSYKSFFEFKVSVLDHLQLGETVTWAGTGHDENDGLIARDWRYSAVGGLDGAPVEILGIGADRSDAYRYNHALESLASISAGDTTDIVQILEQVLSISCDYLSMDIGAIGEFEGVNFIARAVHGADKKYAVRIGQRVRVNSDQALESINMFPLAMAQLPPDLGEVMSVENMSDSDMKTHPFYEATGFETYLGTHAVNPNGIDLSVGFSNLKRRKEPFTEQELTFLKIIWKFSCLWIERQRHVQDLLQQQDELSIVNDNLSRFSYIASHDLQEPLRKIRQFGEMLNEDYGKQLEGDGQYFIEVMTSAATRMSNLVRDLLNYSKTSNTELKLEKTTLDDVLSEVKKDLSTILDQSKAKIKAADLPELTCDPTMIGQLFNNLISNSIKYAKENVPPRILISCDEFKDKWVLEFEDNGIGIDNPSEQDLFEAFTRLHTRDEIQGSGIGLATCRSVCERHGWEIDYDKNSDLDGTKFTITIPFLST